MNQATTVKLSSIMKWAKLSHQWSKGQATWHICSLILIDYEMSQVKPPVEQKSSSSQATQLICSLILINDHPNFGFLFLYFF